MGVEAIVAAIIGISGAAGGFYEGRRRGAAASVGIAVDTVSLLQVRVATLTERSEEKDAVISDLRARVEVLENLVTQRAEVDAVKDEIQGVRGVVDRIAIRIGA